MVGARKVLGGGGCREGEGVGDEGLGRWAGFGFWFLSWKGSERWVLGKKEVEG